MDALKLLIQGMHDLSDEDWRRIVLSMTQGNHDDRINQMKKSSVGDTDERNENSCFQNGDTGECRPYRFGDLHVRSPES